MSEKDTFERGSDFEKFLLANLKPFFPDMRQTKVIKGMPTNEHNFYDLYSVSSDIRVEAKDDDASWLYKNGAIEVLATKPGRRLGDAKPGGIFKTGFWEHVNGKGIAELRRYWLKGELKLVLYSASDVLAEVERDSRIGRITYATSSPKNVPTFNLCVPVERFEALPFHRPRTVEELRDIVEGLNEGRDKTFDIEQTHRMLSRVTGGGGFRFNRTDPNEFPEPGQGTSFQDED